MNREQLEMRRNTGTYFLDNEEYSKITKIDVNGN